MKINKVQSQNEVEKIAHFLYSPEAFRMEWTPGEKEIVQKALEASLKEINHAYWYIEEQGEIIGALGVSENAYKSGGYILDYFSVHENHRKKGLGKLLLAMAEKFVREKKGRYIVIETSDTDFFRPACIFYEKMGYRKTGHIPDYYLENEGKIDYLKKFK